MDLDRWNSELLGDVRSRGKQGHRLYLYVDRDLLSKLSGLGPDEAVADFCSAFRKAMGNEPFHRGAAAAMQWRRDGFIGDPPFVAHLAMTVLAVTEEPIGGSHGIYARQNELLGFPEAPSPPPGYEVDVPLLWTVWNAWLDGPGSVYGRKTAATHTHWSRQGWARSQGLIRYSDRLQLDDYFAVAEHVSFEELLSWLRMHRPEFLRRFTQEPALDILRDVFEEESERWLREGPRARKASGLRGLLQYDEWAGTFSGAVRVDSALLGRTVQLGEGEPCLIDETDSMVFVAPQVTDDVLLRDGTRHAFTETLTVGFGGEDLYVMREDADAGGLVQIRTCARHQVVDVLLHNSVVPAISAALKTGGAGFTERPAGVAGWTWLKSVEIDPADRQILSHLRLNPPIKAGEPAAVLHGGLPLRPGLYLVGAEPDALFDEPPSFLKVDGVPVAPGPEGLTLRLADLVLDPGRHVIESSSGTLTFQSVDFVHEAAVASGLTIAAQPEHGTLAFGAIRRDPALPHSLAGAHLPGLNVVDPVVIRRSPASEVLLITVSGDIRQIKPAVPRWLREIGLLPAGIDVRDALRTTESRIACVAIRNPRDGAVAAIALKPGIKPMEGKVESQARPDLIGALALSVDRWAWTGAPDPRIRETLSRAMRANRAGAASERRAAPAPVAVRQDVRAPSGGDLGNPFDDILAWLSEREHGAAPFKAFAGAWEWSCLRYGMPALAGGWQRAAGVLESLGHIERSYQSGRIGAAPATVLALPSSAGLSLLVGARPMRLLERLDDPDDGDPAVAEAASSLIVHCRVPSDRRGLPTGPRSVYIEWDPAQREAIGLGFRRLGVEMTGIVADALAAAHPAIRQLDLLGDRLTMSPAREMQMRWRTASGSFEWVPVPSDTRPGLYCYQLRYRRMFAWRPAADAPLVTVDFATGEWLVRHAAGLTSLIISDAPNRLLAIPAAVPAPRLLSRALALRSGLPPRRMVKNTDGSEYLVYDNVDTHTAYAVSALLSQSPVAGDIPLTFRQE